jgi:multiple sugar transport system substrate-binding protein
MSFRRYVSKLLLLVVAVMLMGAGCGGPSQAEKLANKSASLTIWRVFDGSDTFSKLMADYQALHPNVSFEYRELRFDEYEDELIRAFAEGRGPDIYSLHNTWIGEYESLIRPMPDSVKIPFVEVRGTIKKEVIYTIQEKPTISLRALKSEFVDAVVDDVARPYQETDRDPVRTRVFGLPLAFDSMAMYYNTELLDASGFPEPPKTWEEFQTQITKLSKIGPNNSIIQAGGAIGTAKNVERSFDLLSLLMMQNGVTMTDETNAVAFARGEEEDIALAIDAVRFYTDFANPLKEVYTWNDQQPDSFDAFTSGDSAFFFGYSFHAPLIRGTSPKLKFAIAPMPQIDGGKVVNYANYWVETVAKATDNPDWAWDFLLFASGKDHVMDYLDIAMKPTARRDLISSQIEDEDLSAFVSQTLTAESWYKGKNAAVAEEAFSELINASLSGEEMVGALNLSQNKINQTF